MKWPGMQPAEWAVIRDMWIVFMSNASYLSKKERFSKINGDDIFRFRYLFKVEVNNYLI